VLRTLRIENLVLIGAAEVELSAGLNALTGETGAGKTIFAQALGLLLGARGDVAAIGPAGAEAYVEAELEVPDGFFDDDELESLGELRPEGEPGLVLARRVFADGRTRAYAWGRAVAREDLAAAAERLIAMSGQFEQRRLARPSYQLELLDSFCGPDQLDRRRNAALAWRSLAAARRRYDALSRDADAAAAHTRELQALIEDTEGLQADEEDALRVARDRLLHVTELVEAVGTAAQALAPDEGDGAASLAAAAERALAPVVQLAPELQTSLDELRELALRLREVGSDVHHVLASLEPDPVRLEGIESRLDRIADLRRRFRAETAAELLERRQAAIEELDAAAGLDPVEAAARDVSEAEARYDEIAGELRAARRREAASFAAAVTEELEGLGMGEGEFRVELREQPAGATGRDEAVFLIRPNAGLPIAPLAETASGGELSRVALALAAVAGGETLVFDEIDAGIGGRTAHRVAETLQRLAQRAQVLTITHLPQIASVADRHFRVEKIPGDPTQTRVQPLDDDERREELERMLGGEEFLAEVARAKPR
jgi:DNA repair protein RecN (Recombination protein N)